MQRGELYEIYEQRQIQTRFHRLDGLGFCQLESCDPLLSLDFGRRLDVEGLSTAVAHDEGASVYRVY